MREKPVSPEFTTLLDYLRTNRGFDFSGYKINSLMRRIQKRMQTININDYTDYIDYLEVHTDEFVQLFNTILINVTSFFRDTEAWEYLRDEIIPQILSDKNEEDPIRVWSTGCASGEEAYSVAILLCEAIGEKAFKARVKIYATDIDDEALSKARLAVYSEKMVEGVPEHLLTKYFTHDTEDYVFNKDLRRNLIFGRNDLIQDAPISRIDLLICRNTLMYFNAETQAKILSHFHFALNDNGFIFVGKSEMLFARTNIFQPVNLKLRIFSKVPRSTLQSERAAQTFLNGVEEGNKYLLDLVRDAAFELSPVAQILVNTNKTLIAANREARQLFRISSKEIGQQLQDLEISYRPFDIRTPFERVLTERAPIQSEEVYWQPHWESTQYFSNLFQPLIDLRNTMLGVNVFFRDVTEQHLLQATVEQTNAKLETALEELQSTYEELETTNEELQSTIEELETTNEELQSTNEELETMNEELQSSNEELHTINEELRARTIEVNSLNLFLESILTSVRTAVAVLDRDLETQVWNWKAEDMWGVRVEEAIGKNFLSLDIGLPLDVLKKPLIDSIVGQAQSEEITLSARNRKGRDIFCAIKISPLVAADGAKQGVVILMDETETMGEVAER